MQQSERANMIRASPITPHINAYAIDVDHHHAGADRVFHRFNFVGQIAKPCRHVGEVDVADVEDLADHDTRTIAAGVRDTPSCDASSWNW